MIGNFRFPKFPPWKKAKWLQIAKDLGREKMLQSNELGSKYEALRNKLVLKPDGSYGPPEVVEEMKAIESKKEAIWRPHRTLVGPCLECNGTREPGTMDKGYGFGCIRCHDFELYGRGLAPGDPRKAGNQ